MREYTSEMIAHDARCNTCDGPVNTKLLAGECLFCYERHRRQARKIVTGAAILVLTLIAVWVAGRG